LDKKKEKPDWLLVGQLNASGMRAKWNFSLYSAAALASCSVLAAKAVARSLLFPIKLFTTFSH